MWISGGDKRGTPLGDSLKEKTYSVIAKRLQRKPKIWLWTVQKWRAYFEFKIEHILWKICRFFFFKWAQNISIMRSQTAFLYDPLFTFSLNFKMATPFGTHLEPCTAGAAVARHHRASSTCPPPQGEGEAPCHGRPEETCRGGRRPLSWGVWWRVLCAGRRARCSCRTPGGRVGSEKEMKGLFYIRMHSKEQKNRKRNNKNNYNT